LRDEYCYVTKKEYRKWEAKTLVFGDALVSYSGKKFIGWVGERKMDSGRAV